MKLQLLVGSDIVSEINLSSGLPGEFILYNDDYFTIHDDFCDRIDPIIPSVEFKVDQIKPELLTKKIQEW